MKPTDEQAGAWTEAFDSGKFVRKSSEFRDVIQPDGTFEVESNRYHLYVSHACPWAHRTLCLHGSSKGPPLLIHYHESDGCELNCSS